MYHPHYIYALGGYNDQHSWLVGSALGIEWHNLPPKLESILSLQSLRIAYVSLGPSGQYFVKAADRLTGRERRYANPLCILGGRPASRVVFASAHFCWVEFSEVAGHTRSTICDMSGGFDLRIPKSCRIPDPKEDVQYAALSGDQWVVGSQVRTTSVHHDYSQRIHSKIWSGEVVNMTISSFNARLYIATHHDGSVSFFHPHLNARRAIEKHCKIQHSLELVRNVKWVRPTFITYKPQKAKSVVTYLSTKSAERKRVQRLFYAGWEFGSPPIITVFRIELSAYQMDAYEAYTDFLFDEPEELLYFHGTRRRCSIGDSQVSTSLCSDSKCNMCSIIESSFSVARAGSRSPTLKYGQGIYTASSASKAHNFTVAQKRKLSPYRAMLVARVVPGLSFKAPREDPSMNFPPIGFNSVTAMDKQGKTLVVYDDDAIRPAYLIIYNPSG